MSLKLCYECSNQVSRKAIVCPKCGVPLQKGPLGKKVLCSLAFIYSILFWYFFKNYMSYNLSVEWLKSVQGTFLRYVMCVPGFRQI